VDLADETVVGLPRSRLVKSSQSPEALGPALATTMPQMSPFAFVPETPAAVSPSVAPAVSLPAVSPDPFAAPASTREPFRTKADSVEIEMDGQPAMNAMTPPLNVPEHEPMRGPYASAPSANELLERAASMGPPRMTWESIVSPADPILDEKRQPHVAERRARLTRVVKVTLGACLGVCVLALGVSAISAITGGSSTPEASAATAAAGKTVPSKAVVPIEPMAGTKHAKASRQAPPAATTAAIVRPKRR
jgi:hypothetical protein